MKGWLRRCQAVLMLALAGMAPALLMSVHGFDMWLCGMFAALYAVSAAVCLPLKGRRRLPVGLVFAAAILAAGIVLLPWREKWWTLALPIGYVVLLLYTLPIGGWEAGRELSYTVSFTGACLFAAAQVMQMIPSGVYASIKVPLIVSFLCYVTLWLFMLNRQSLQEASSRGQGASGGMRQKNKLFTAGLIVVILLLSSIPALARALRWMWDRMLELVMVVLRFLSGFLPETTAGGAGGGGAGPMEMLGEVSEPSLLAVILEKIFAVLAVIGLCVALFFALRIVWRKLRVLVRKLWKLLGSYAQAASEDYVDEIADTRETGETSSSGRRSPFGEWFRQVNEDRLTPVERVRYRYRRLLRRHQEWQPGSTARENLPPEAASIYERARYSRETIDSNEAETFAQHAKTLEKKG
ncbi:MAG: hypothetical protein J6K55_16815 [Clostridia bacterium]|nr:hypothetical protein [Clostridia bacterium]